MSNRRLSRESERAMLIPEVPKTERRIEMGGKRWRWIYFQLYTLCMLAYSAFGAALALALPSQYATISPAWRNYLEGSDLGVLCWIPLQIIALLVIRKKPETRRARMRWSNRNGHYETFVPLFIVSASALVTGFYGVFGDPVTILKQQFTAFTPLGAEYVRILSASFALGAAGILIGTITRYRTAFLILFAGIGASSLWALLSHRCITENRTVWHRVGCNETLRLAGMARLR